MLLLPAAAAAAAAGGDGGGLLDYRYEHQCGSIFLAAACCPRVHPCGSRSAGEFGGGGEGGAGGTRSPAARRLSAVSETFSTTVRRRPRGSGSAVGRLMDTAPFVAKARRRWGSQAAFRRFNPFSADGGLVLV